MVLSSNEGKADALLAVLKRTRILPFCLGPCSVLNSAVKRPNHFQTYSGAITGGGRAQVPEPMNTGMGPKPNPIPQLDCIKDTWKNFLQAAKSSCTFLEHFILHTFCKVHRDTMGGASQENCRWMPLWLVLKRKIIKGMSGSIGISMVCINSLGSGQLKASKPEKVIKVVGTMEKMTVQGFMFVRQLQHQWLVGTSLWINCHIHLGPRCRTLTLFQGTANCLICGELRCLSRCPSPQELNQGHQCRNQNACLCANHFPQHHC